MVDMPQYNGVSVAILSPDVHGQLPEQPPEPPLKASPDEHIARKTPSENKATSTSIRPVIECSITASASSQFWIQHSTSAPDFHCEGFRYLFYKLSVDGICLVSWGSKVNEQEPQRIMFGLDEETLHKKGKHELAQRPFFFTSDAKRCQMDIHVYRSKARRHISCVNPTSPLLNSVADMDTCTIADAQPVPRKYEYALLDTKDDPFVTFTYHVNVTNIRPSTPESLQNNASPQSDQACSSIMASGRAIQDALTGAVTQESDEELANDQQRPVVRGTTDVVVDQDEIHPTAAHPVRPSTPYKRRIQSGKEVTKMPVLRTHRSHDLDRPTDVSPVTTSQGSHRDRHNTASKLFARFRRNFSDRVAER